MFIHEYFAAISEELNRQSNSIRKLFASHRPSAGRNREKLIADFLRAYLPKAYGIDTGLILASTGEFSNQVDIVIFDDMYSAPLFPDASEKLWLIESVYAMIEVKTELKPEEIQDAITKCRRFKKLSRHFDKSPEAPRIEDSLFILWAFAGPKAETALANIRNLLQDVPVNEQPDIIVIPNSIVITAGAYRDRVIIQKNPSRIKYTMNDSGGRSRDFPEELIEGLELGNNALLISLIWIIAWLKAAGHRSPMLSTYIETNFVLGEETYIPSSQNLDWTYE